MSLRSLLIALTFGVGACSREESDGSRQSGYHERAAKKARVKYKPLRGEGSFEPFQKNVVKYVPRRYKCFDYLVRNGTMSEKEQAAIYSYTKGIHGLNERLRAGGEVCPFCLLLQSALTKIPPIKESLTVYRGESWAFEVGSTQRGQDVEWDFLVATSISEHEARGFAFGGNDPPELALEKSRDH